MPKPDGSSSFGPILIHSAAELMEKVKLAPAGRYALACGFNLPESWKPLSTGQGFALDGCYHAIGNIHSPLFGQLSGATVKNLMLEADVGDVIYAAALCAVAEESSISFLEVSGKLSTGFFAGAGGVAVRARKSSFENITNRAEVFGSSAGGIASVCVSCRFIHCHNKGQVKAVAAAAGICPQASGEPSIPSSFEHCANTGEVLAKNGPAAGIASAGGASEPRYLSFSSCINTGPVTSQGEAGAAGGIASHAYFAQIKSCDNYGAVKADGEAGGIAGLLFSVSVEKCTSAGPVASAAAAGGIAGCVCSGSIDESESLGAVSSAGQAGGIAGSIESGATLSSNTAFSSVASEKGPAGGIVGEASSGIVAGNRALGHAVSSPAGASRIAGLLRAADLKDNSAAEGMALNGALAKDVGADGPNGLSVADVFRVEGEEEESQP